VVSFTDGSRFTIIAEYLGYTSSQRCEDEYPTDISLQFGDFRDLPSTRKIVGAEFPIS
jgi:hypothetical protein